MNVDLINKNYTNTLSNKLTHKLISVEASFKSVSKSFEMANFLNSPEQLRGSTANLLYARISGLKEVTGVVDSWKVHKDGATLLEDSRQIKNVTFKNSDGWSKVNDNYLVISIPLMFDDQYQISKNSTRLGTLSACISIDKIKKEITNIKNIISIPVHLNHNKSVKIDARPISLFSIDNNIFGLTIIVILLVISTLYSIFLLRRKLFIPIKKLTNYIEKRDGSNLRPHKVENEIVHLQECFSSYIKYIEDTQQTLIQATKTKALNEQASQVAHDIRSPLAALNAVSSSIEELPEMERLLILNATNRIQEIAENLLEKRRSTESKLEATMVLSLIPQIILEKNVQFTDSHIAIELKDAQLAYGLFSMLDATVFKRILSNLINNAVEATNHNGKVEISVKSLHENIVISCKDNGKGIPSELKQNIFKKGFSHGKENGSGLGLYHANKYITQWGGQIEIESHINEGTNITITLPKCDVPNWFTVSLDITDKEIVILDDDESIHSLWNKRFSSCLDFKTLNHFTTSHEFKKWENSTNKRPLYLIDHDLLGDDINGLEIIKQLGIENNSILVTSKFQEDDIIKECVNSNIKLLPKNLAQFIPIRQVQ